MMLHSYNNYFENSTLTKKYIFRSKLGRVNKDKQKSLKY